MKVRAVIISILALVLVLSGAAVSAQDGPDACLGLSPEDCQLINTATMNTLASAQSFSQNWEINFSVTGVPDSPPVSFNATGTGPVVLDMNATGDSIPLSFQQDISVDISSPDGNQTGTLVATLVDNIFYIEMDGQAQGFDLMEAMNAAESGAFDGMLPVNPAEVMEDPTAALGEDVDMEAMMGLTSELAALSEVPGFLTYTRDGNTFNFTADLVALISAPEFTEAMNAIGEASGDPQSAQMAAMLPMMFDTAVMTVQQRVDEANMIVNGLTVTLDATVDPMMITGEQDGEPVVITFMFNVDMSDINNEFSIAAPANATLVPLNPQN